MKLYELALKEYFYQQSPKTNPDLKFHLFEPHPVKYNSKWKKII